MFGVVAGFLFGVVRYMLVLLYSYIAQSIRFTNIEMVCVQQYLNVVHEHHEQYNMQ
jgi:hypothetical protein